MVNETRRRITYTTIAGLSPSLSAVIVRPDGLITLGVSEIFVKEQKDLLAAFEGIAIAHGDDSTEILGFVFAGLADVMGMPSAEDGKTSFGYLARFIAIDGEQAFLFMPVTRDEKDNLVLGDDDHSFIQLEPAQEDESELMTHIVGIYTKQRETSSKLGGTKLH